EEVQAAWGARPAEWLLANAPVGPRWCLIHLTQKNAAETAQVAKSGAVAGLCPITESSLGDGIFNGVAFLGAGGRFGIGSDSDIRISLSEELRTLEYSQRLKHRGRAMLAGEEGSTGRALYRGAAHGGAQALRRASGAIAPGLWADLLALDTGALDLEGKTDDLLLDGWIFAGDDRMVREVWSAGRQMVAEGRHVARDVVEPAARAALRRLKDRL
ncbi:MAG: amidohydrolase family protein, partial [Paracoccaceae bacterium]